MVLLHRTLGLRVAFPNGFLSFPFVLVLFLHLFSGYHGSMRKSGILYPNQHIDSDCFSAALPIFELFSHTIPFDAYPSSSKHRRQDSRLSWKGMHHEHFTPSLFLQACCLGSYRFSLFRVIHTRMAIVSISFLYFTTKAIPFSRSYPSATTSFSSSLCLSNLFTCEE